MMTESAPKLDYTDADLDALMARIRRPVPEHTLEREQAIRALYVNHIDDLHVSYMVHVGNHIHHQCLASREVCIREHSYWMRLPGPITLQVHESQEERIILRRAWLARQGDEEQLCLA